mmetsp:Transcript_13476/g.20503  ORF Transcript_13476/g.20503 Transcript_13476/m.20503 type:complete len:1321 (-) Transcript_13476:84-4046(-)|eukprot:CAMPEP_0196802216 /NCGR_PEP_ID=MMETSP1362-20130617/1870_1 /TAXON_ID=163516 /ORGANISM="Leptocylindrus danicus, Strain CCMP1856" /LENGTH=1320 /DNA_ID=CAMNT_0042173453 /DNA_START=224 /DNA_END=4186 /DNA_ORIENTATION=-
MGFLKNPFRKKKAKQSTNATPTTPSKAASQSQSSTKYSNGPSNNNDRDSTAKRIKTKADEPARQLCTVPEESSARKSNVSFSEEAETKTTGVRGNRLSLLSQNEESMTSYRRQSRAIETAIAYESIPFLDETQLPRGGVSVETEAVGRVQFGIPPETIKDSMNLGLGVPVVYIVPVDRFCRDMGPALGVNLAEFEFPAYFNFFVQRRRCTLVVDSEEAENSIRRVFDETLLGPTQFRNDNPIPYEEEDFAPDFPRERIPDFAKELKHFRTWQDGNELVIETLLNFVHFTKASSHDSDNSVEGETTEESVCFKEKYGRVRPIDTDQLEQVLDGNQDSDGDELNDSSFANGRSDAVDTEKEDWTFSLDHFNGRVATVYPTGASEEAIAKNQVRRVEIFTLPGGTGYVVHDVDEEGFIVGRAKLSSHVQVPESMHVDGFGNLVAEKEDSATKPTRKSPKTALIAKKNSVTTRVSEVESIPPSFYPPSFGVTVLGNSHGFDKNGSTSGYVLWVNGRGIMIDPPPYSNASLEKDGIRAGTIVGIILTHCHADHDAGAFQKVLKDRPVVVITTPTIYKSFIRKYAALSGLSASVLMHSHRHRPAIIGKPLKFQGATFYFTYSLHTIPCVGFRVEWRGRSMVFTGDHFNSPDGIKSLTEKGILSEERAADMTNMPLQDTDLLLHEAGAPPIHTPLAVLQALPDRVKEHLYVVHTSKLPEDCGLRIAPTGTSGTIRLDQLEEFDVETGMIGDQFDRISDIAMAGDIDDVEDPLRRSSGSEQTNPGHRKHMQSLLFREQSLARINSSNSPFDGGGANSQRFSITQKSLNSIHEDDIYEQGGDDDIAEKRRQGANAGTVSLVMLRPTSSSDAWFNLNLLSSVPFFTSLSYSYAMEVLETARVDAFCVNDVVVRAEKRRDILCVFWEGVCMEKTRLTRMERFSKKKQPISSKNSTDEQKAPHAVWFAGDWTGPRALQPDLALSGESETSSTRDVVAVSGTGVKVITIEFSVLHTILLNGSDLYRKYNERLRQQAHKDKKMFKGSSATLSRSERAMLHFNMVDLLEHNSTLRKLRAVQKRHMESIVDGPFMFEPDQILWKAGEQVDKVFIVVFGTAKYGKSQSQENNCEGEGEEINDEDIQIQNAHISFREPTESSKNDGRLAESEVVGNLMQINAMQAKQDFEGSETEIHELETKALRNLKESQRRKDLQSVSIGRDHINDLHISMLKNRRSSTKQRFTNKVFNRLYDRDDLTSDFVFSRGNFLGDVSRIVGDLAKTNNSVAVGGTDTHQSTLIAGNEGCVAVSISKENLKTYLDNNPGLLLCLLGTEVVV